MNESIFYIIIQLVHYPILSSLLNLIQEFLSFFLSSLNFTVSKLI